MRSTFAIVFLMCPAICFGGEWIGFVYPNQNNLTVSATLGAFDEYSECKASSQEVLEAFERASLGTFECGYKCRPPKAEWGLWICNETRDD